MKILRLALSVGPSSPELNQFTLPVTHRHAITLCTFFCCGGRSFDTFEFHEGDGRIRSFLRLLWQQLRDGDYDVVHVHSPHLGLMFLAVAILVRPEMLARSVLHLHSSYPVYRLRNRWMLLPSFLLFARLVCCGRVSHESFPKLYRWLAGQRLTMIPNGANVARIDAARATIARRHDDSPRPLRLAAVGRMRALKNHAQLIQAFARIMRKDVLLTIYGGGALLEKVRSLIVAAGLADRIFLAGELPRDELFQQLWMADGFVSLSRGEGLPMAVLEAMACQCPVILSDIDSHREIAAGDSRIVRLVELTETRAVTREIDRWAALSAEQRQAWGAECRALIATRFTMVRMLDQFERLTQAVVAAESSTVPLQLPHSRLLRDNVT